MFELPTVGPLLAVAIPIVIIFLVLGVFRIVQRQAEDAVRSPEYWEEEPDGRKYPTGWGPEEPDQATPDRTADASPETAVEEGDPEAGPEPER
ncbi:hypothetical protein [Nocardiopsis oceani]